MVMSSAVNLAVRCNQWCGVTLHDRAQALCMYTECPKTCSMHSKQSKNSISNKPFHYLKIFHNYITHPGQQYKLNCSFIWKIP